MSSPNQAVTTGTPLLRFVDTKLRNEYEVAERNVLIAQARYQRAAQEAFQDPRAKREVAISKAELSLARSERDYAKDRLSKVDLVALQDGVAIYTDKRDWEGRPVAIGEHIIQLARPDQVELAIDVPVGDSIALAQGARIKVFLDSDPLNPLEAELTSAAYHAEPTADGLMAYRVRGQISDGQTGIPRIGARGSAQIFGEEVPLYFYLFRLPIAAFRQYFGL